MVVSLLFPLTLQALHGAPAIDSDLAHAASQAPASASAESALSKGRARVRATLVSDVEQVTPQDTLRAGILFEIEPGWHIYWRNSGEAAAATELVLDTLQGTPGEIQWPFPKVYREALGGLTTFGYDDTVLLFAPIEVTETSGVVEVSARADFLACETECVPGSVELTRTFPIAHSTRPSSLAERFEQSERRVPVSPRAAGIDAALQVEYETLGPAQTFRAWYELSCEACESLELAAPLTSAFVPYASDRLARSEAQKLYALHPNRVALELASRTGPGTHSAALAGVVGLAIDGDFVAVKLTEPVPRAVSTGSPTLPPYATDAAPASPLSASMSLWQLLLFSFLGGMLLNLMPCVLPVLAIKVVSFTEIARRDRSAIVAHSSAYATAVVGSMLMLALLVVALRAAGTTVGWGFQFQSPLFVSGIGALLVAFSLNLFGVFELSVNATGLSASADSADGLRRSFLEGVLAVLLATPCTAPLLGSAVGFALSQPPWVILLAFFTIGLGLAAPFVILVLAPGASRFLPAPGNWMVTLKQVLGFVLLGSALWLAWVVGRGYGEDAMAATLAFFITVGIAVWLFGRWQLAGPKARWASRGLAVGVLMVAGAVFLRFYGTGSRAGLPWQTFSPEAVRSALDAGRPVFVNFTADWCITCKVNENTVFAEPAVRVSADAHRVALYKADWTKRDPEIEAVLARYGKAGVPAYLLYSPKEPDKPQLLPEILTPSALREAFKIASQ